MGAGIRFHDINGWNCRMEKSRPWGSGLVGESNRVRSTRLAWGVVVWRQAIPGLTTSAIELNARRRKAQP